MRMCVLVLAAILAAVPAFAQETPACDGDITIVRVSTIKPGGSIEGFMAGARAHQAWYRANGMKDNEIVVARVMVQDPAGTGAMKYSDTEILTFHLRPPRRPANAGDAAWESYVKQYQDNSEIRSEHVACVPKHGGR